MDERSLRKYADELSYLLASPLARKIVIALEEAVMLTPTEIGKAISVSTSNVSTKLIELRKKGLVECITPERRKCRFYGLSVKCKKVVRLLPDGEEIREKIKSNYGKGKIQRI